MERLFAYFFQADRKLYASDGAFPKACLSDVFYAAGYLNASEITATTKSIVLYSPQSRWKLDVLYRALVEGSFPELLQTLV